MEAIVLHIQRETGVLLATSQVTARVEALTLVVEQFPLCTLPPLLLHSSLLANLHGRAVNRLLWHKATVSTPSHRNSLGKADLNLTSSLTHPLSPAVSSRPSKRPAPSSSLFIPRPPKRPRLAPISDIYRVPLVALPPKLKGYAREAMPSDPFLEQAAAFFASS
jgi:hypothetical protein